MYMDEPELTTGCLDTGELPTAQLQRHPTLPSTQPSRIKVQTHRSNSTATCLPSQRAQDYIEMMHPRAGLLKQDYVMMRPAGTAVDGNTPPRSLSPITEAAPRGMRMPSDNYENHPLPFEVATQKSYVYQTPYENVEQGEDGLELSSGKEMRSHRQSKEEVMYGIGEVSISGQVRSTSSPPVGGYVRFVEKAESRHSDDRLTDSPSPVVIEMPT